MLDEYADADKGPSLQAVLLVEDDPIEADAVRSVLESHGLEVLHARDGMQAYSLLSIHTPDIVALKLILPNISGFEVCERIKRTYQGMAVAVLSEIDLDASRQLAIRVDADAYITKPVDDDTLIATLRDVHQAVWERSHAEKQPEDGHIRFKCRCGRKLKEKYDNRGKFTRCDRCDERTQVPFQSEHDVFFRGGGSEAEASATDPLRFVTVQCESCSTYFRLYDDALKRNRVCPKCGTKQNKRKMSIVGAPLSRAALANSMRLLVIVDGPHKGKKVLLPVGRTVIFGRGREADFRYQSSSISRKHVALKATSKGVVLQDLGSRTGTWIDGAKATGKCLLPPGGELKIGKLRLRLVGADRTTDEAKAAVQRWFADQERARETGERIYSQTETTASDAAAVIELWWEVTRRHLQETADSG